MNVLFIQIGGMNMRIERVNESTIKFYLTYADIEERGFNHNELWTSRKKGEEFFWRIMEEVNQEEEFVAEGPLWIQVHAFDKGIEFVVTKSKQNDVMQLPEASEDHLEYHMSEFLRKIMKEDAEMNEVMSELNAHVEPSVSMDFLVEFPDLESVIQFSHANFEVYGIEDLLYSFENKYYYYVEFQALPEDMIDAYVAHILEYANDTSITKVVLDEYGKIIMSHNVRNEVKRYFTLN